MSARSRAVRWLLPVVLLLPALVAALLWWGLRSESGAAWLLAQAPGLKVLGSQGTLLGSFRAGRVELALPRGGRLVIEGLRWTGLRIEDSSSSWGWGLVVDRLEADRVEVKPGAPSSEPWAPPDSLSLPFGVRIAALRVAALQVVGLGDTPLRELQAALQLGADGGRTHRVDGLSASYGPVRAKGTATLGSAAPLPLQATLELAQDGATDLPWSASLAASGPLAALPLQATLRAAPHAANSAAQSLDLTALLRPFAAWPLGDLDARAQALDLSALIAGAPQTAISGQARVKSEAADRPALIEAQLDNSAAGRWNEGRLPVHQLKLELAARPDDPQTLELRSFDARLGNASQPAGRLQGRGRWTHEGWQLDTTLAELQPGRLDARAAAMSLAGALRLAGSSPGAAVQSLSLQAELNGLLAGLGRSRPVQIKLDAEAHRGADGERIELREAQARAGGALATLKGSARRDKADAPWQLQAKARLSDFDPQPWWPGPEDSPWRRGPHRVNATAELDLRLPPPASANPRWADRLASLSGQASLQLADSLLAGVPLRGQARLQQPGGQALEAHAEFEAAGNRIDADGRVAQRGNDDHWELAVEAPALAALSPLWRLLRADRPDAALAGTLSGRARLDGRWPSIASNGQASAGTLRIDGLTLQRAQARWQAGTRLDAAIDAHLTGEGAALGPARLDTIEMQLQGSGRAHRLTLRAHSPVRPPAWVDAVQGAPAGASAGPTVALLQAEGGLVDEAGTPSGWRGTLQQLELRGGQTAWLSSRDLSLELSGLAAPPLRVTLQPGRAELLGAALRWSRVAWRAADAGHAAQLEAQAELEPIAVAPILSRLQPSFGWGGDLRMGGRLEVASAPSFRADVVLERQRGDLTVTDETGTQALGLSDLRLGLNVADGVWSFTQGFAGSTLGVAAGAFVARTTPQASWPAPEAPVSGVLELQVANLGTWGTWVPAGWRLGGALRISAGIGGTFGAPEFTGDIAGHALSVRNFLQGVNVSDGEVQITLQGPRARIERFSAKAGEGTLRLEGDAVLGAQPVAQLSLVAQRFQVLGRVDRRIVASGDARLRIERNDFKLDGQFGVDEGLIDFTRSDAPSLADDVVVKRGPVAAPDAAASAPVFGGRAPTVAMDLRVALGERLRVRGRGLDTRLAGDLRLTSPGNRLAVNGTVRAVDGTYAAYGQKLEIDKGELIFNGPAENPRLDIEATRPNLDVRVGVAVTGTAAIPRVRLFSEPELSEIDKLSWLVLGRASDGLGRTDTALLQRAAVALLAGDKQGPTDQITQAIGLDDISLRQTDGEVRETVVSLGKQLSRRWYVGYERSLNATAGTWQLIYRIAQRFTLRAQSGEDSSLDVIWTWRWN